MSFESEGFEIVRSFLDSETLEALQDAAERACRRFREADPYCTGHGISVGSYGRSRPDRNPDVAVEPLDDEPYILGSLAGVDPAFRRLVSMESLWSQAAYFLGASEGDIVYHSASLNRKPPQIGPAVGWHRDYGNEFISTDGPFFVRLMISLTSMDSGNAGIALIPGSHAVSHEEALEMNRDLMPDESRAVCPTLLPGDLLAVHSKLVHGGGPNRSDRARDLLVVQFGRAGAPPLHFSAESEFLVGLDRAAILAVR